MIERVCRICRASLVGARRDACFCSARCRTRAYRERLYAQRGRADAAARLEIEAREARRIAQLAAALLVSERA